MQKINFINEEIPDLSAETLNQLQTNIETAISEVLNQVYPIGRGFIDFTNTDFSNYLGFTWERELVGLTPIGIDETDTDFNTIGKTGGEKSHTLTIEEMPKHRHDMNYGDSLGGDGTGYAYSGTIGSGPAAMLYAGSNQPHNNLPPYKVVAYWKRTA